MSTVVFLLLALVMQAQEPRTDGWPTYNGDYSGRRYSTLTNVNADNVKHLSLAWSYRLSAQGTGPEVHHGCQVPVPVVHVLFEDRPEHRVPAHFGIEAVHQTGNVVFGAEIGTRHGSALLSMGRQIIRFM